MQGVLQLLEKAEIRDVLATAGVQFEQLKRMGPFGGVVLQLQGIVQKGFKVSAPPFPLPQSAVPIQPVKLGLSQSVLCTSAYSFRGYTSVSVPEQVYISSAQVPLSRRTVHTQDLPERSRVPTKLVEFCCVDQDRDGFQ